MDAVSTALTARQELASNGLKQAAKQEEAAVALVEQAVTEAREAPTGRVTATRGSHVNILV
jgi:hypothetical protein